VPPSERYKGTGSSKLGNYDKQWLDRYEALKEYKEKFGDSMVSQTGPYPVLGRWVNKQRDFYRLYQAGKRTTLTEKRIDLLKEVGFVWDASARKESIFKRNDASWLKQYELLKAYKDANGNCHVPRKFKADNMPLGEWVHKQRQQYSLMKKGKYSTLSAMRIEKLNELNFHWPSITSDMVALAQHHQLDHIGDDDDEQDKKPAAITGVVESVMKSDPTDVMMNHHHTHAHAHVHVNVHEGVAIDAESTVATMLKTDAEEIVAATAAVDAHTHNVAAATAGTFNVDVDNYLRTIMPAAHSHTHDAHGQVKHDNKGIGVEDDIDEDEVVTADAEPIHVSAILNESAV